MNKFCGCSLMVKRLASNQNMRVRISPAAKTNQEANFFHNLAPTSTKPKSNLNLLCKLWAHSHKGVRTAVKVPFRLRVKGVVQLVERRIPNAQVVGSIPATLGHALSGQFFLNFAIREYIDRKPKNAPVKCAKRKKLPTKIGQKKVWL